MINPEKDLDKETNLNIQELTQTVHIIHFSIKRIDEILLEFDDPKQTSWIYDRKSNEFKNLKKLYEYTLLISLIGLDLACAVRIYVNRKSNYEVRYAAKNLVVTLNEGYKKIYHVVEKEKRNSFWIKDIGELIQEDSLLCLNLKYSTITNALETYFVENWANVKEFRDLAVHYDKNVSKVYDMILSLDIENIVLKVIPFMNILREMTSFCNEVLQKYSVGIMEKDHDLWYELLRNIEEKEKDSAGDSNVLLALEELKTQLLKLKIEFSIIL